uniref:Uncharacterized protein n=1 Tax=Oryza brachyantha TaxID=4533 RepID=J3N134_ORYBR
MLNNLKYLYFRMEEVYCCDVLCCTPYSVLLLNTIPSVPHVCSLLIAQKYNLLQIVSAAAVAHKGILNDRSSLVLLQGIVLEISPNVISTEAVLQLTYGGFWFQVVVKTKLNQFELLSLSTVSKTLLAVKCVSIS